MTGGPSFSLDRQWSGEWKVDGFTPPNGGGGSVELPAQQRPQLPQR
jgi:hypothetical protein